MEVKLKRFLETPGKQRVLYIAGGIATVLMAAVIFCNLLLIVSNIREPNQMPSVFGIRPAIVLSGSMSPTFEAGDMILLKKTKKPDELEVGDVACYLYSGKATTHRVIERFEAEGKPRYIMKGDYNNVEDRLAVDPEQIQGVWTGGRIRHLGKFLMFLQSTMGMFLFLICPLAGVLAWDILRRRKADRLRQEYGEGGGYEYGEGQEAAGLGRIAAFRGMLGYRTRRDDSREGTEEAERRRGNSGRSGDEAYSGRLGKEAYFSRSGEDVYSGQPGDEAYSGRSGTEAYSGRFGTEAHPEQSDAEAYSREDMRKAHLRDRRMEALYTEADTDGFYESEDRNQRFEDTDMPRPSSRRPPVSERKRTGEFYRDGEARAYREEAAAARRTAFDSGRRSDRDDEFYYYSQLDEELDYYQELEDAAEHYRKMKESLKRYRRMEAVMNRCRRLEEELSRYEALADRLEAFERTNLRGRQNRHAGTTGNGVSDRGARQEPPVDHIDRPGGMTPPRDE